jgi:hypothetical protein
VPPSPVRLLLAVLGLGLLAGCQVDLTVGVRLDDDGSGSVTVAAGLDAAALARAGNLEGQLRVDDLRAAGWTVTAPTREGETTWVRASKPFSSPDEAAAVIDELTGPDGAFRGFEVRVDDGMFGTDYSVRGTVDLTEGPRAFGDDELAAALGGDPFGGTLEAIERDEGRPISEMVDFHVVVDLPGADEPTVYELGFADGQPTEIDTTSSRRSNLSAVVIWGLIAVVIAIALLVLRRGFRRVAR